MPSPTPPNRIRELRREAELSRADVASTLGVDATTVYRWETGRLGLPDERKHALVELLSRALARDVTIPDLMGWAAAA